MEEEPAPEGNMGGDDVDELLGDLGFVAAGRELA